MATMIKKTLLGLCRIIDMRYKRLNDLQQMNANPMLLKIRSYVVNGIHNNA